MPPIERPGIDEKWMSRWKWGLRNSVKWMESLDSSNIRKLEFYVQHGFVENKLDRPLPVQIVDPPRRRWETYLGSSLWMYAAMRQFEFERKGIGGTIDMFLASHAFAAMYTAQMIRLHIHNLFPVRLGGRKLRSMSLSAVPFTAMGVAMGCEPEAFRLARMQLAAFRRDYFFDRRFYPIFQFALRILADYLDEPPFVLEDEASDEPILTALFEAWREPNATALTQICLAACDHHTRRCKSDKGKHFYEFNGSNWPRLPIEILLLFKLRRMIGLENPQLDHPLMNTALGALPPEAPFEPGELIGRVRARLQEDGYDEQAIYDAVCATPA
jgi:hypothetical protein